MTVCRDKRINRIYIPIWVTFTEAKYSPALWETVVFHSILFLGPTEIFLGFGLDYSLFCVLLIWIEWLVRNKGLKAEINSQISKNSNVATHFKVAYVIVMERKRKIRFFSFPFIKN